MASEVELLKNFLSEKGSNGDIVPHDTNDNIYEGLFVGTGGNVQLINKAGQTQLFLNLPDAYIIPVVTSKVMLTNTTASNIIGL